MANFSKILRTACTLVLSGVGLGTTGIVMAQAAPAEASDNGVIDEVVITTGVARPVNRLESSVSTSAVSIEAIEEIAPRSVAEVFRSLPGIRAESSGGNGNANITIRGIPLATAQELLAQGFLEEVLAKVGHEEAAAVVREMLREKFHQA